MVVSGMGVIADFVIADVVVADVVIADVVIADGSCREENYMQIDTNCNLRDAAVFDAWVSKHAGDE